MASFRSRLIKSLSAAALVLLAGLVVQAPPAAAHLTPNRSAHFAPRLSAHVARRVAASGSAVIRFSHGVPIDEQRPGFEPDVAFDPSQRGRPHFIYSSIPFGFSTTESFIWLSRDGGRSYQLTPGQIGPGKPTTCAGGGDTELQLDAKGSVFFSDLQGLTNLSNSVSTDHGATWSTNCAAAPNTPVDRMWFGHIGTLSGGNLSLYEEYDAVESSLPSGQNQLVESVSHDGLTFGPLVNSSPGPDCAGGGAANCVTDNEGLPGNQIVDRATKDIFIVHSAPGPATDGGAPQVLVERGKVTPGTPDTATWTHIGPINKALCPDPSCVDSHGNSEVVRAENFPVIAEDSGGHFNVVFTSAPVNHTQGDPNIGAQTAPEQIFVAESDDDTHWKHPVRVTSRGTNTFPWIVAGSSGRIDLAWYHTGETSEKGTCQSGSGTCTVFGAGSLLHAKWSVQFGQSLNADSASPAYRVVTASEHLIKHGQICTNGLGCTTGGDRSMGDFMQITADRQGAAIISYVDDTSQNVIGGEATGPAEIVRQISGPSIRAKVGQITHPAMGRPFGRTGDRKGDAFYAANGSYTKADPNLDLRGASIRTNRKRGLLVVRIRVSSLQTLSVSPQDGGADASWFVRWVRVNPNQAGNGHIWYAGMESDGGGSPTFFDGDVGCQIATTHCKYMTWPGDKTIKGRVNKNKRIIKLLVPLKDVGSPPAGTKLFNALAFSTTETQPLSADPVFNLIDSTQPFTAVVR